MFVPQRLLRPKLVPAGVAWAGARLRLAVLVLTQLVAPPTVSSQTSSSPREVTQTLSSPRFRLDQWRTEDGLPGEAISFLSAGGDGYLWMVASGLATRFDGQRARPLHPDGANQAERVRAILALGADSMLLLATGQNASVLRTYAGGRLVASREVEGLWVQLARDRYSRLWLGGVAGGIARLDSALVRQMPNVSVAPLYSRQGAPLAPRLYSDRFGDVWVTDGTTGRMGRLTDDSVEYVAEAPFKVLVTQPSAGEVLIAHVRGARVTVLNRRGDVLGEFPAAEARTPRLVDRRGRLWVSNTGVLEAYRAGSTEPVARVRLPDGVSVDELIEDREGNLWARTGLHGLFRIREEAVFELGRDDGIRGEEVLRISRGAAGSMLLVDLLGNSYRFVGDRLTLEYDHLAHQSGPIKASHAGAHAIARVEDGRGTRWTSFVSEAPHPYSIEGQPRDGPPIVLRSPSIAHLILEDPRRAGEFWVATKSVMRVRPYASGVDTLDRVVPVSSDDVRSMGFDQTGALWVPAPGALVRIADDTVERIVDSLIPERGTRAVYPDSSGAVWIGTYGSGLLRYKDGVVRQIRAANGLVEDIVSFIEADDAGNLWMAGNRAIHRVRVADVEAFFDGRIPRVFGVGYSRANGLTNPETSGWNGARDDRGRLWFPTFGGAVIVDPVLARTLESVPPIAHIDDVRATSDSSVSWSIENGARAVSVAASERRLEFVFSGVSLRDASGLRLRYRLDGYDDAWQDADLARRAVYGALPGGRYTFRVQAVSGGGIASSEDAVMIVNVATRFTDTPFFYVLLATTLIAVGVVGVRVRERQLLQRQAALNRLVSERTQLLSEERVQSDRARAVVASQAERLRSLVATRSRMFANVSHEFRTPLTLILGPLRDLRDGRLGALPLPAHAELDVILRSGEQLNALVDELLDIARLEVGELKLNRRPVALNQFVQRVMRGFEPLARVQDITFSIDVADADELVEFDPEHMEKVLNNLVGNAFKFSAPGGRVHVSAVVVGERAHREVVLQIEDKGLGIPADELPRIFERFYQVEGDAGRPLGGTGVGLALASEIVGLHGGTITVRSELGVGSDFEVRLPAVTGDDAAQEASSEVSAPHTGHRASGTAHTTAATAVSNGSEVWGARPQASTGEGHAEDPLPEQTTILVAEDNDGVRAYLRRHLSASYRVVEATNGRAALALARQLTPDLIISDVMMPLMDGQALLRAIRADPEIDYLPVILLTARASQDSRLDALEVGADDYVTKPFDVAELLLRVRNQLEARRRLRERATVLQPTPATKSTLVSPLASPLDTATAGEPTAVSPHAIHLPPAARESDAVALLSRLHASIAQHLDDEDFGIDELARDLNMSRSTLFRNAQEAVGHSPMDVIWGYRLDVAARWLRESDAKVNEIAYGVGFKSVPHFSRKFRERFGLTPTGYRMMKAR